MKHIVYFFKRIFFGIIFPSRNYKTYPLLDVLLIYLKEVGIDTIDSQQFDCHITFKDGTKLRFWNSNKYYAWMSNGEANFSNGENLKWESKMPSREVVFHFMRAIRKYEKLKLRKIREHTDEDIVKYLPIKLIRKIKLEKLEE